MSRKPRSALVGVSSGLLRWSGTPKKARKYSEAESSSMRRSGMRPRVAARGDHAHAADPPGTAVRIPLP